MTSNVLTSDPERFLDASLQNSLAATEGAEAFADRYNSGQLPGSVAAPFAAPALVDIGIRPLLRLLVPISLIGTAYFALIRRRYWLGAAFLVPTIVHSVALGWLLLDNVRFLLPVSAFLVVGFCGLMAADPMTRGLQEVGSAT